MNSVLENKVKLGKAEELLESKYPLDVLGNPEKPWSSPWSQQGDCHIKKCGKFDVFVKEYNDIPKDAKKVSGNLVLKGNTNSHALYFGDFQLFEKDGVLFIDVKTPTILDHVKDHKYQVRAEHHSQWLPVGKYFVDDLLEYDHLLQEARKVID